MPSGSFEGVHCVLFALWAAGGALDRGAMRAQAQWAREAGADGLVVLGLAMEAGKLSARERGQVVDWAGEDAGPLPLAVTVGGATAAAQRERLRAAEGAGAAWAILQPAGGEADLVAAFAQAAEGARVPLAVQDAPQFLGRSLGRADLAALAARAPAVGCVKAEASAVELAGLVEALGPGVTVLAGRGGLEMTDSLRAGARGLVVAPDVLPGVVACWRAWDAGDEAGAERAYAAFLPAATFGMQSLGHLHCYGKRVWGMRAGVAIHDRAPAMEPTAAGLAMARRWARGAG